MSKRLSPLQPNDENKRGIDLIRGAAYRKALYFTNGDSFRKVRGMINLMRSKVKVKFTRKKKKVFKFKESDLVDPVKGKKVIEAIYGRTGDKVEWI